MSQNKESFKEPFVIKVINVVVIAAIAYLAFAMLTKHKEPKVSPWIKQLAAKYSLDTDKPESYYEGFSDAIDYVYDHLDELGLYRW